MKAVSLALLTAIIGLPSCQKNELSCSSPMTESALKGAISTPRNSQAVEDYTPEIDITLTELRRADIKTDAGWTPCIGQVTIAASATKGLPIQEFGVGYEIRDVKGMFSIRVLVPDRY